MNVFDRKVKKIQRERAALREDSRSFDFFREEVASRLMDRLYDLKSRKFDTVLELGTGTGGTLLKHFQNHPIKTYIQADFSEAALRRDEEFDSQYSLKPHRVVCDEEFLPFQNNSFDLVVSHLSLHWLNDLPGTLIQIRRILKEDGLFLATIVGSDTLHELRTSFLLADRERQGGVGSHISPLTTISDCGNLLTRAGFNLTTVDMDTLHIRYSDLFRLMEDLQGMGESHAPIKARRVSPDTFLAAAAIFSSLFPSSPIAAATTPRPPPSSIVTVQVVYMIGWSPSEKQPKPKARGSGNFRLSDIGSTQTGVLHNDPNDPKNEQPNNDPFKVD